MADKDSSFSGSTLLRGKRVKLFGLDTDQLIQIFFGGNAFVAIIILTLITVFLFKEGYGFLGQYRERLDVYRQSGVEYVDILNKQKDEFTALNKYLSSIRTDQINLLKDEGLSQKEVMAEVQMSNDYFMDYMRIISDLRDYQLEKRDIAVAQKDRYIANETLRDTIENYEESLEAIDKKKISDELLYNYKLGLERRMNDPNFSREKRKDFKEKLEQAEKTGTLQDEDFALLSGFIKDEIEKIEQSIQEIDFADGIEKITSDFEQYREINDQLAADIKAAIANAPSYERKVLQDKIDRFIELNEMYLEQLPEYEERLQSWNPAKEWPFGVALTKFLMGTEWVTNSSLQDWYGILPLFTGSLLISLIALTIAVPFGVGAAIYINQIAGPKERNIIKPYIEFIEAIPSVVIGFFGVVVLGHFLREASQWEALAWVPGFPMDERLNALTAGCLLALMAIPTIFTLSEDAINNIPRHFKEGSFALGATRWQTIIKIIVPTALSGIISAVMLGFGRVVGETMVVLLCAGNRIRIPDFTEGLGVFFEPVHTMTGIVAQELPEVVNGSLHYRALFMVGIFLFFLSLIINYIAQLIVKKFKRLGE